jgi:hypothetical protein
MAAQAFSDYFEDKILNWFKGSAFPTQPTNLFVGLFTALPGDTGSGGAPSDGTEATGNGYARVSITAASAWSAISTVNTTQRHITNSAQITFPAASGGWGGNIVGWGIWDASSAGNLLFYGTTTSFAVINGMTPFLAAAAVDVGVD